MIRKKDKEIELLHAAAESVALRQKLCERSIGDIISAATFISRILKKGGTVLLAGNGGSASDCEHFAAELVVRLTGRFERKSLPAISLTANSSIITSAGNDYGFENIFSRQIESLAGKNDLLVLISTSGNSKNLIEAAKMARKKKTPILCLLGGKGGKLKKYSDHSIIVPSSSVQRIQEEHIFIIHNLVHLIEQELF